MVRSRKSHATDEEVTKSSTSRLPPPFLRSGDNPYVVYAHIRRDNPEHNRQIALIFGQVYAARYAIDRLIHNSTWEQFPNAIHGRPALITADPEIEISCSHLWEILDYELSPREAEWSDPQVNNNVLRFKYGEVKEILQDDDTGTGDAIGSTAGRDGEEAENDNVDVDRRAKPRAAKTIKPTKPSAEAKPPRPKAAEGTITAQQLAEKLGCEGRHVRGVLRASGRVKPETGWSFDPAEAEKVEAEVTAFLKKKGLIK